MTRLAAGEVKMDLARRKDERGGRERVRERERERLY